MPRRWRRDDGDRTQGEEGAALAVEVIEEAGRVRIAVRGDLDLDAHDVFDPAVEDCKRLQQPLVVDLRQTTFIGSQGVAAILRARRQLGDDLGPITVCVGRDIQRRVFEVTGVDSILHVVDHLDGRSDGDLLTIFEVSEEVGTSPKTILEMVERGELDGTRVGRTTMVPRRVIARLRDLFERGG